jgi:hypothetical protein
MNRSFLLVCSVVLAQSYTSFAQHTDYRNFAIATFYPNTNEIQLSEGRARRYWQKNHNRLGNKVRYLAVETTSILPPEITEPLWPYLLNAETGQMFLSTLPNNQGFGEMNCVMIFDTKTRHFVGRRGYLAVENPPRGTFARYDQVIACFIGSGRYP